MVAERNTALLRDIRFFQGSSTKHSTMFLHLLLLSPFLLSSTVWSYNFDVSAPTVTKSGIDFSRGTDGFGFSLTQHEFPDGRKIALVSSIFINGTDLNNNAIEKEGGVYSCPFDNRATCRIEPAFQSEEDNNPDSLAFGTLLSDVTASYERQLMGYSLRSYKNHVLACAPLYVSLIQTFEVNNMPFRQGTPNGRCVVLNKNLSSSPFDILQITNNDLGTSRMIVGGVDTNVMNLSGSGNMEKIIIGSVMSGKQAPGGNPLGQVIVADINRTIIGNVVSNSGVDSSDPAVTGLLGYRTVVGRFTEAVLQVASSAPKGNMHRGYIRIYNVPNGGGGLSLELQLDGEKYNGYFGYDFTAYSFSEDGFYDSLIVGCPLCDGDRGAVYVYLHTGDTNAPFPQPTYVPPPNPTVPGRFGMSVSLIGDIDLDGISDFAVSAPYEERGVVYIYRGSRKGLVMRDYQSILASPDAQAFGYSLSGGLDIDNNGYPDLSISDLSGRMVTTVRSSPLVSVKARFSEPQEIVDLVSDRKCQVNNDITLLCFSVTPCFYYKGLTSEVIPEFAFQYTLTVDNSQSVPRVVPLLSRGGNQYTIGTDNTPSQNITVMGAGTQNELCPETYTFAIRADFVDIVPIPVRLEISESESVPPLPSSPTSGPLGGPLHPVLQRYILGDQPAELDIEYEVHFGINCSGGVDDSCEPDYSLQVKLLPNFSDVQILAPENSFAYSVTVDNTANDDGLSPLLRLDLPDGILFNETVAVTENAVTNCSGLFQLVTCLLRNPLPAKTSLSLTVSLRFNVSAITLSTRSLSFNISVVDGTTGRISAGASLQRTLSLRAEASYGLDVITTEQEYQARRHALSQETYSIPLNNTGPTVRFSVLIGNSRDVTNGTTIPISTLTIHIPISIQLDRDRKLQPLLIPYQLVSASGNVNCSRFNVTPEGLSPIQLPPDFIPIGVGPTPSSRACENQKGELAVKCGAIVCTVRELEAGKPPSQVNVFAYLFSPSIVVREDFKIFAEAESSIAALNINKTSTSASFEVLPSFVESSLVCFQYWIIVVSVVAGLLSLLILVTLLACCGLFGRWYKRKGESPYITDSDAPDNGSMYGPRTIPPLPETELTSRNETVTKLEEEVKVDLAAEMEEEKEREAEEEKRREEERRREEEEDRRPESIGNIDLKDIPLNQFTFDPHTGVIDSGDETEI